MLTLPLYWMA